MKHERGKNVSLGGSQCGSRDGSRGGFKGWVKGWLAGCIAGCVAEYVTGLVASLVAGLVVSVDGWVGHRVSRGASYGLGRVVKRAVVWATGSVAG